MRILVICQYYFPEPFRISDICEELVKQGHEVTVITGLPNYPMGEIYEEYRKGKKRDEVLNGVKIHRCFTIGRKHGVIYRFLNYYSYAISSTHYVKKIKETYDVVFVNQLSPVMMANAAIKYKKRNCVPLIMYCLDLWPESLIAGGVARGRLIYKFFHRVSEKVYKQADRILITSRSFADYFEEKFGITNTEYLPQYSEAIFTPEQCQKQENKYIDLMFAGNLGAAQSIDTIIKAAELTSDISNLRWHIVGDGSELENLKKMAQGMNQVIFYGRKPVEEMPKYYAMADAMLVTMKDDPVLNMTLPGKVQTYMAAGKPIIVSSQGESANIVNEANCGIIAYGQNEESLALAVRKFINSSAEERVRWGNNGRQYYNKFFSKAMFVDNLEKYLLAVSRD